MKTKTYLLLLFNCFSILPFVSYAQDSKYSQPLGSPLYVNPAFAGTTPLARAILQYRSQWPQLPGEFVSTNFAFDYNLDDYNSSVGFLANLDKAGSAGYQGVSLAGIYSYMIRVSQKWRIKTALQAGYGNRSINYFKLIFGDQITATGTNGGTTQEKNLQNLSIHYFDLSTGALVYNKNLWAGFSAHHLNQPSVSLAAQDYKLPMQLSGQIGAKIPIESLGKPNRFADYPSINPMLTYTKQGAFQSLDVFTTFFYDPLIIGLGYRNLPIQEGAKGSVTFMAGVQYQGFRFTYSYDLDTGNLASTGGAHEVTVAYKWGYDLRIRNFVHFPALIE